MLKPVEKQRVAAEIVGQLRSLILTGAYVPGDKLPPERELAKRLGVNRASLREALKRLEHEGLVQIRQGDGTRVLDFMQTGGLSLVSHLIPELLPDVLEFRRLYGREVARLAAERATPEDLARLAAIADHADAPNLSSADLLRLDFDFYVELTRATRNRALLLLINTVRQAVDAFAPVFERIELPPEIIRRHHRALLRALERKDATAAARIADAYLGDGS